MAPKVILVEGQLLGYVSYHIPIQLWLIAELKLNLESKFPMAKLVVQHLQDLN